jgi:repressor LexA
MTKGLTEKQERILAYIVEYVDEKGYPPSIREIGNAFSISSLRGVTVHLDALERKGYIKRASTSRSITVVGRRPAPKRNVAHVPLVGTIAAGVPILASENVEELLPVPTEMVSNVEGAFALRVKGDSMIDDHIMPSDVVLIRPQQTANNGDLVAVLIDEEATVKRIQFEDGRVWLLPSNPNYSKFEIRENSRIIGKVVGLLRSYGHPV